MDQKPKSSSSKILSLEQLAQTLEPLRKENKKIVLCHGVFDLLHPGHIRHLNEARKMGDVLVVTLTRDRLVNKGPGRPAFTETLRAESIAALESVNFVALNETATAVEAINLLKPSFYVKGQDYEDRAGDVTKGIYDEESAVERHGGKIAFTHDITFSSTNIINSHFSVYPEKARPFLESLKQTFTADGINDELRALKDLKVLVIGDTIVDEYVYCAPMGKSPKETIVTTRYINEEAFPGGILACANHVAAFSDNVHMVTVLGSKNTKQDLILSQLNSKVSAKFFQRHDSCTTIKRRYVEPAFLTKMFQITYLTDTDLPAETSNDVARYLLEAIPQYDMVLVADYGHGFLNSELRSIISQKSKFLALNVQTNSANIGYNLVTKYSKADYICIDEPELRLAMQERYTPIHDLVAKFAKNYKKSAVTITRGHNGSLTALRDPETDELRYFESPSLSSKIVDRVGAGDAYLAVTSMLAAKKAPAEILGLIGNAAGAMAVEVVCNRTSIQAPSLFKFVKALLT